MNILPKFLFNYDDYLTKLFYLNNILIFYYITLKTSNSDSEAYELLSHISIW